MNKDRFSPDDLRIASPCTSSWEAMDGDARRRFCAQCDLHVYNVAELTRAEVAALVAKSEGRLCMRLYRRADGTVLTRDCPVGLRALRRRVARRAGAVFAALLGICAPVFGKSFERGARAASTHAAALTLRREPAQGKYGVFSGVVKDPRGTPIDGARVTLTDERQKKRKWTTKTDDKGGFSLLVEKGGRYKVEVEMQWFVKFEAEHVELSTDEAAWADIEVTLELPIVGMILSPDYEDRSPVKTRGANTTINVDALRGVRPRD